MPAYRIHLLRRAERTLRKLSPVERKRISSRIDTLADEPRPAGCVAMKGSFAGHYRIRVGKYRVIYRVEEERLVVVVVRIGHRREVYR